VNHLTQNDLRAFSSALEKIYNIPSPERFSSGTLSAIKGLFSCNTICYNEVILPDSMTTWITEPTNALPGPTLREAFMSYFTEHPVLACYAQSGDGRSYRISDFLSNRQFHDLARYNEYYRQSSVEYQLVAALMLAPGQMAGTALDRDCADFTVTEALSLDLIRLHLMQAYRNVQTLDLMKRATEETGSKLLVASRSGQARLESDEAWRTIARYFDVLPSRKSLPDVLDRWINYERARFCQECDAPSPSVPIVINNERGKLTLRFMRGGKVAGQDLLLRLLEHQLCVFRLGTPGGVLILHIMHVYLMTSITRQVTCYILR
jgi:hypothetical protein